ncbi:IS putative transposase [Escherichia coli]|nr:IS putative transposase [Escherichia coli]
MKHSFEIKLAAVNHYLAGHAGIISTAKLFQLSHTSLSHWINLFFFTVLGTGLQTQA